MSPDPLPVERECFWGGVHNGQAVSRSCKAFSPPPGSACELEHVPLDVERPQRGVDARDLVVSFAALFLTPVVPAASLPPLVVFRGSAPVVRALLAQRLVVDPTAPTSPSAATPGSLEAPASMRTPRPRW